MITNSKIFCWSQSAFKIPACLWTLPFHCHSPDPYDWQLVSGIRQQQFSQGSIFDFGAAFDLFNCELLITKLSCYGLSSASRVFFIMVFCLKVQVSTVAYLKKLSWPSSIFSLYILFTLCIKWVISCSVRWWLYNVLL